MGGGGTHRSSSRSDAYPGGFTGALFPDVLASAKSSRHFAAMSNPSHATRSGRWRRSSANRAEIGVASLPNMSRRSGIGSVAWSRGGALARSDGASGLRWLDRAPCAPKFGGARRKRSSLNRLGREPSLGRANVFQPSGRRASRSLSRTARWDANETSRGEARSFRSYNHLTFDASESRRASRDGWPSGERRRPVTTSQTERRRRRQRRRRRLQLGHLGLIEPPPEADRRRPPPADRPSRRDGHRALGHRSS